MLCSQGARGDASNFATQRCHRCCVVCPHRFRSLMFFSCLHVSACDAFDTSCGGVHHVEHLFFFVESHLSSCEAKSCSSFVAFIEVCVAFKLVIRSSSERLLAATIYGKAHRSEVSTRRVRWTSLRRRVHMCCVLQANICMSSFGAIILPILCH